MPMKTSKSVEALRFWSCKAAHSLRCAPKDAFTMVGNIGALAVIAILVAVTAPSVIRRVDHAVWTRETADLQNIADAYTQYILTNKTIPGTNWASSVANYMNV